MIEYLRNVVSLVSLGLGMKSLFQHHAPPEAECEEIRRGFRVENE